MTLIQKLTAGPVDIVGDIHGEIDSLVALINRLGYDQKGNHPENRKLVFVGDFCDRGPDSPTVINLVEKLVQAGNAFAVLGNHELNLIRHDAKDGSGWFFDERNESDHGKYAPYVRPSQTEKEHIISFLLTLPIALERSDIRIIHAAWMPDHISQIRAIEQSNLLASYQEWDLAAKNYVLELKPLMEQELTQWTFGLEDSTKQPPLLHVHAEYDSAVQMMNPLRVLTSGVERKTTVPFFASGKWRFAERVTWWNEYDEKTPVIIGHYWRRFHIHERDESTNKGEKSIFEDIHPLAWHGKNKNVFCVDYSIGGRWAERKSNFTEQSRFKLAALQWPERVLVLDDGESFSTEVFLSDQIETTSR